MVEHLLQIHKALGNIPKSSEDTKYSRKTTIFAGFEGIRVQRLNRGEPFSSGLIEGFLPATLPNNLAIYKENRDSQSWQRQVARGSNGTLPSTKLGQNSPVGRAHL